MAVVAFIAVLIFVNGMSGLRLSTTCFLLLTILTSLLVCGAPLQRCKHFEIGGDKKTKGAY
jgi:hypothetical protein